MRLYHYGSKRYKELLTPELQGTGLDKRERAKKIATLRKKEYPYYMHVSFLLEEAPLDILGKIFPSDHHSWAAGNKLWEHTVNPKDIDLLYWEIVESKISVFMVDHLPWLDSKTYQSLYFSTRKALNSLAGNSGRDVDSLIKVMDRYSGATRKAYAELANRDDYDEIKNKYAATVPHLMVYTDKPISVESSVRVQVATEGLTTHHPKWLSW